MLLYAGYAGIDSVLRKTRRLLNAVEQPVGTFSTDNNVWHG